MKKNVNMPDVLNCAQTACAYNKSSKCHALGITVGGGRKEDLCDTLIVADKHTTRSDTSGVGACKTTGCVYNDDRECSADKIDVGLMGGQTECMRHIGRSLTKLAKRFPVRKKSPREFALTPSGAAPHGRLSKPIKSRNQAIHLPMKPQARRQIMTTRSNVRIKQVVLAATLGALASVLWAGTGEDDLFAGTWHGTLSGEAVDIPYEDLGFSMDIRNLEIGTLQTPEGEQEHRALNGSASAVHQNPTSTMPEVRAFLNRYETAGPLDGVMYTDGVVYENGEAVESGWHIDVERADWQPGGWEEALTEDGWIWFDDFEGGVLSTRSVWHLNGIDVVSSNNNNSLTLSKSYEDAAGLSGYQIQGVLHRITNEQHVEYPGDLEPGERTSTDEHTLKQIHIPDVADVTVSPESEIEISEDGKTTRMEQFKGGVLYKVREKVQELDPDRSYEIISPQAVAGVRGTELWTQVDDNGETSVDLLDGDVDMAGNLSRVSASGTNTSISLSGSVDSLRLYDNAVLQLRENGQVGRQDALGESTVCLAGGHVDRIRALENSRIQMAGGSAAALRAEDNSLAELFGGSVDKVEAVESATVQIYGKNFTLAGDLDWGEDHEITGTGTLSGEWVNQEATFSISIRQNSTNALLRALTRPATTDNGIPYRWLIDHGFSADGSVDHSDPCDKGMTVLEDYVAGTNPNETSSLFKIEKIRKEEKVKIYFSPNSTNRLYTLWRSSGLNNWEPVPGQESVPGGEDYLSDSEKETAASAFYRVGVQLP